MEEQARHDRALVATDRKRDAAREANCDRAETHDAPRPHAVPPPDRRIHRSASHPEEVPPPYAAARAETSVEEVQRSPVSAARKRPAERLRSRRDGEAISTARRESLGVAGGRERTPRPYGP